MTKMIQCKLNGEHEIILPEHSAKVTIGDSLCLKKENSHYWSDRVPEATGRGGLRIMPNIKAIKEIYPTMPTYEWGNFNQLDTIVEETVKR